MCWQCNAAIGKRAPIAPKAAEIDRTKPERLRDEKKGKAKSHLVQQQHQNVKRQVGRLDPEEQRTDQLMGEMEKKSTIEGNHDRGSEFEGHGTAWSGKSGTLSEIAGRTRNRRLALSLPSVQSTPPIKTTALSVD